MLEAAQDGSRQARRPRAAGCWIGSIVLLASALNAVAAHYTPQWAVHVEGGDEVADRIAAKHGFVNLGKIFEDLYHFEHKAVSKRSLEPSLDRDRSLLEEAEVKWAKQQVVKRRSKRDLLPLRPRQKFGSVRFNDVRWPQMWYLNRGQGLDMNVQPAWQEGISGKGVVVTILDDGLEKTHPDLVKNYDPHASYDVNSHDEDPMPRYDIIDSNRHGTRCAGEVAAVANNSLCSVGVAFGASVGGVRMLDGDVTDAVEARSLSLNPQHIDIYSASWGPDDDGKTVDGPGELATRAFIEGVTKGRQGKGSIFVWASGNGGRDHDNCNCDGYANSIWTLSISSATENGGVPWYSEACSSTLATTYSSGAATEKQIVTTDLHHQCTNGHTGTSASAPLAAGICALALEANRDLTWRDMQHIVVRTARPANLVSSDWKVNGVGRNVSHSFGYGLMDATAMVRLARVWKTVPEQHRCEVSAPHGDKSIPARSKLILNLNVTECPGVNFLEHVQAKISLSSARRGDLQIYLTSPAGTRTTLLAKRPQDSSKNPFNSWPFMSVHTWGEMPFGIWQLEIHNEGRVFGRANLQEWSLLFYGTAQIPLGAPGQKLAQRPQAGSSKSNGNQGNNARSSKNTLSSSNFPNRKNAKAWKGKTSGRIGKGQNPSRGGGSGAKISVPAPTKNPKPGQRFWYLNKTKPYKGTLRTTVPPQPTQNSPLTIVLGPSGNLSSPQKVPDIFQKYPKVQQLYPIYVNTGRMYNEENLIPKAAAAVRKNQVAQGQVGTGPGPVSVVQKAERQDRYDTSSAVGGKRKSQTSSSKKAKSRNQNQGNFEGWQMLFYGTENSPNAGGAPESGKEPGGGGGGRDGDPLAEKDRPGPGEEVPNHLEAEAPNRGWKDQATRRDEMLRTTTADPSLVSAHETRGGHGGRGGLGAHGGRGGAALHSSGPSGSSGPSSGCAALAPSSLTHCIECISGLFLIRGRCEAKCPASWYQSVDPEGKTVCLPCHYTCLTCVGEGEGECTSCYDEAVPVVSGFAATTPVAATNFTAEADEMRLFDGYVRAENLPMDNRPSYGRRSSVRGSSRRSITKKILEPLERPRTLFFCYPARLVKEANAYFWYFRVTLVFACNLLLGLVCFCLYTKWRARNKYPSELVRCRYTRVKNGDSGGTSRVGSAESAPCLSSTEEE